MINLIIKSTKFMQAILQIHVNYNNIHNNCIPWTDTIENWVQNREQQIFTEYLKRWLLLSFSFYRKLVVIITSLDDDLWLRLTDQLEHFQSEPISHWDWGIWMIMRECLLWGDACSFLFVMLHAQYHLTNSKSCKEPFGGVSPVLQL